MLQVLGNYDRGRDVDNNVSSRWECGQDEHEMRRSSVVLFSVD
jgi:hypothetical protein